MLQELIEVSYFLALLPDMIRKSTVLEESPLGEFGLLVGDLEEDMGWLIGGEHSVGICVDAEALLGGLHWSA